MSIRTPFRLSFLDQEPSLVARQAEAAGYLRLISSSDPDQVDGVVIDRASSLHADLIAKYVHAGVAVLSSAPSIAQAAEYNTLVKESENASGRLLTAYRHRWRPEVIALDRAVKARELGLTGLVRMNSWSMQNEVKLAVHQTDDAIYFPLRDMVDAVLWIFGALPRVVYASGGEGCMQAHIGFVGGGMALLDIADAPFDPYEAITLIGSNGAAHADDHHNMQILYDQDGIHGLPIKGDAERALLRAFANGATSSASAENVVSSVTEAILQSLAASTAVRIVLT